jgi:hypothetical protein
VMPMIEDTFEEFHMVSSREGGSGLPSPRRHGTGALPAPIITTPRMENALATQAMTIVPPRMAAPRPNTSLPFEQWCTCESASRPLVDFGVLNDNLIK